MNLRAPQSPARASARSAKNQIWKFAETPQNIGAAPDGVKPEKLKLAFSQAQRLALARHLSSLPLTLFEYE